MIYLLFMTVLIAVVVAPVVIYTVSRIVPRVIERSVPPVTRTSPEVEARLTRIEEAIDAMAIEIERIRTGDLENYEAPRRLSGVRQSDNA
jgi:hypothetical protein